MKQPLQFAPPMDAASPEECAWYHTFRLPDGRIIRAAWDHRECVDDYLGHLNYRDKSVLEIGPASGFFTVSLEQRGAAVVAIETSLDQAWEAVPRADLDVATWIRVRREGAPRLFKSWWYAQRAYGCSAKIVYCGVSALTDVANTLKFDVCFIGGVLQHVQYPIDLLWAASKLADVVVVTERWLPLVENNLPIAEFVPSPGNSMVDTWWHLSSVIIKNAMNVFGFDVSEERRFNTKAWKLEQDDIKEDTCVLSEHYNIVFQRRQRV